MENIPPYQGNIKLFELFNIIYLVNCQEILFDHKRYYCNILAYYEQSNDLRLEISLFLIEIIII